MLAALAACPEAAPGGWADAGKACESAGGARGRAPTEFNAPGRTTKYPREVPPLPWFRQALPQMAMAGARARRPAAPLPLRQKPLDVPIRWLSSPARTASWHAPHRHGGEPDVAGRSQMPQVGRPPRAACGGARVRRARWGAPRAGFLPFSAIYIELHYIFSSIWGHKARRGPPGGARLPPRAHRRPLRAESDLGCCNPTITLL